MGRASGSRDAALHLSRCFQPGIDVAAGFRDGFCVLREERQVLSRQSRAVQVVCPRGRMDADGMASLQLVRLQSLEKPQAAKTFSSSPLPMVWCNRACLREGMDEVRSLSVETEKRICLPVCAVFRPGRTC